MRDHHVVLPPSLLGGWEDEIRHVLGLGAEPLAAAIAAALDGVDIASGADRFVDRAPGAEIASGRATGNIRLSRSWEELRLDLGVDEHRQRLTLRASNGQAVLRRHSLGHGMSTPLAAPAGGSWVRFASDLLARRDRAIAQHLELDEPTPAWLERLLRERGMRIVNGAWTGAHDRSFEHEGRPLTLRVLDAPSLLIVSFSPGERPELQLGLLADRDGGAAIVMDAVEQV